MSRVVALPRRPCTYAWIWQKYSNISFQNVLMHILQKCKQHYQKYCKQNLGNEQTSKYILNYWWTNLKVLKMTIQKNCYRFHMSMCTRDNYPCNTSNIFVSFFIFFNIISIWSFRWKKKNPPIFFLLPKPCLLFYMYHIEFFIFWQIDGATHHTCYQSIGVFLSSKEH